MLPSKPRSPSRYLPARQVWAGKLDVRSSLLLQGSGFLLQRPLSYTCSSIKAHMGSAF